MIMNIIMWDLQCEDSQSDMVILWSLTPWQSLLGKKQI